MPIKYEIDLDREHGSGVFYVYWRDGRQKRASLRTKDRAQAEINFHAFMLTQGADQKTAEKNGVAYSFADFWAIYFDEQLQGSASEKGARMAWKLLELHFGRLTVTEINQKSADAYVARRTAGELGRKVQPQTVRKELTFVIAALRYCSLKVHGKKMFDPNLIEPIRKPDHGGPKDRWLRDAEIDALHAAARRLRPGNRISREERFLYLGLHTAGREQAIYDLTWDRIDFEQRTIDLRVTATMRISGKRRKMKNRASVPMSDDLFVFLRQCYEERIGDLVMDSKASVWKKMQKIVVTAGLAPKNWVPSKTHKTPPKTGISPHVLRHTAATHMARKGKPLWLIANILGNTLAVVEDVYASFCPDEQSRDAVNVMSRGLRPVENREIAR